MIPYYADYINAQTSMELKPSQLHLADNAMFRYFKRYLLQRALSVFRWSLPVSWSNTLFLYTLYCCGVVAVVNTDLYGVIPTPCTLSGRGVQFEPTRALINNPLLEGNTQPRINTECGVVHLMPDYGGIGDLVNHYACEMALTLQAYEINLQNSKLAYVFGVGGSNRKASAESLKRLFDQIQQGTPAVFADASLLTREGRSTWQLLTQNLREVFLAPELLELLRKLEAEFAASVGIPANLATAKKERLVTSEVDGNNVEVASTPSLWLDTLRRDLDIVNYLFDLNITVDWRYTPDV